VFAWPWQQPKQPWSHGFTQGCLSALLGGGPKGILPGMTADPEELRPKLHNFPWGLLVSVAIAGLFFSIILLLWTSFQSIRSQLYVRRENKSWL
jgi:hypothetical protein